MAAEWCSFSTKPRKRLQSGALFRQNPEKRLQRGALFRQSPRSSPLAHPSFKSQSRANQEPIKSQSRANQDPPHWPTQASRANQEPIKSQSRANQEKLHLPESMFLQQIVSWLGPRWNNLNHDMLFESTHRMGLTICVHCNISGQLYRWEFGSCRCGLALSLTHYIGRWAGCMVL